MLTEKNLTHDWIEKWTSSNMPPNFPHYSSKNDRLKSFDTCSESIKVKPQALSEAGFFYLGPDDRTVCFHCGGGLNEWKKFDDPWVEHAYWFPRCNYVLTVRGKEFVDNSSDEKQETTTLQEMQSVTDALREIVDIVNSKKKDITPLSNEKKSNKCRLNIQSIPAICDTSMLCIICYVEERDTLFIPCRHMVACSKCSSCLSKCAVCRESIKDILRIYPS